MSALLHRHVAHPNYELTTAAGKPRCQGEKYTDRGIAFPPAQCTRPGRHVEKVPGAEGFPPVHFCVQHAPTRRRERLASEAAVRMVARADREAQAQAIADATSELAAASTEVLVLAEEWLAEIPGPLAVAMTRYLRARNGARTAGLL